MRILFVGNLNGGGRERRMAQLIVGLSHYSEYEVRVVVSNPRIDYLSVSQSPAEIIFVDEGKRKELMSQLNNVIDAFNPDVVHLWAEEPRWLITVSYLKLIHHFKLVAGFVASGSCLPFFSRINIAYQVAYLMSDSIVSNSYAGIIARHAPKRKARVIKNGFDFKRLEGVRERKVTRDMQHIGGNVVVSMVGRFEPLKDWDMFLNLADKFQTIEKNAVFLSIGAGVMQEMYEEKCREMGLKNVVFMGRRDDVESLLLASDIFVLFNPKNKRAEGISNAIMEAMAAGLPVIATNAGGTPEIIDDNKTGFLVEAGDLDSASLYLEKLIKDESLRESMGKAARLRIKNEFSLKRMTLDYINLYKEIVQ